MRGVPVAKISMEPFFGHIKRAERSGDSFSEEE